MQGTGKSKWRSMEEIKQEMKDIDLKVTEDYLTMKALLEDLEQEKDGEKQVKALEELEFHVHQYDNAVDFLQLNGIIKGVLPALNSSHNEVSPFDCHQIEQYILERSQNEPPYPR